MPPRPSAASFALVQEPEGVLTFAFGPKRYRQQAISLAQSVRLHNPGMRLGCITDGPEDENLRAVFDIIIPFVPERGKALQQKLWFDAYTPFERTAFIDSDCLVVGPIQEIISGCRGHAFAPLGHTATKGWWYMDIAKVLAKYNLPFMPRFNGGYYYFEQSPAASALFARARQVGKIHKRLNIYELGLWFNEEVFYALAMAWQRLAPVPDLGRAGMYTPDEFTEPFFINVIEGGCHFVRDNEDYIPRIVHFFGRHGLAFQYLRERTRLSMHVANRPFWLINLTMLAANAAFGSLVAVYRLIAWVRGKPLPFTTNFPVASVTNFGGEPMRRWFERD